MVTSISPPPFPSKTERESFYYADKRLPPKKRKTPENFLSSALPIPESCTGGKKKEEGGGRGPLLIFHARGRRGEERRGGRRPRSKKS